MMKSSFLLACIIMLSCAAPKPKQPISLVGKTIEYRYGESVYHVTIDTDSTLHWEAVAGDEKGVKANETYVAEFVAPQQYFIAMGR